MGAVLISLDLIKRQSLFKDNIKPIHMYTYTNIYSGI